MTFLECRLTLLFYDDVVPFQMLTDMDDWANISDEEDLDEADDEDEDGEKTKDGEQSW